MLRDIIPFGRRPFDIMRRIEKEFFDIDEWFEDFFVPFEKGARFMRTDIKETENEYIIEAELPGVKKEDIKIELYDNRLTIKAETKREEKEERENFIRRERRYGAFSRTFYLDNVKEDGIKAKYEDGILKIILPKEKPSKPNVRTIDIE
ncbi:Hsp20/alpha crystallin family protein [Caldicellulosiruptor naganoensis]|uniref:Hsp20/alpha crystallin family protein n=1 Tax=Caldicellulosiruptor naganoensis TaxID=29324 RepID=A0ABY7BLI8_9FIRM|nr:Hsp20/alpha crystallin family protein [Caldicellulosiruptor naganoensis]WAM32625.1 Hsp20/alpha crystallin family protein [Caldicellulosiruptor naganoensis]